MPAKMEVADMVMRYIEHMDHRPNLEWMILGLVVNGAGVPTCTEIERLP